MAYYCVKSPFRKECDCCMECTGGSKETYVTFTCPVCGCVLEADDKVWLRDLEVAGCVHCLEDEDDDLDEADACDALNESNICSVEEYEDPEWSESERNERW